MGSTVMKSTMNPSENHCTGSPASMKNAMGSAVMKSTAMMATNPEKAMTVSDTDGGRDAEDEAEANDPMMKKQSQACL